MTTVIFGQGEAGAEAWPVSMPSFVIPEMTQTIVIGVSDEEVTAFADVKDFAGVLVAVDVDVLIQGYLEWSYDGIAVSSNYTTPFLGAGSFTVPLAARYARIRAVNLGASTATLHANVLGHYQPASLFLFPAAAPIDGSFPAALVKSIETGQQPDGDYVNGKAGGTVFNEYTPLGTSETFESDWFDTDGWQTLELTVATDQVSASNGVELQYTDDVGAVTPLVRASETFTYTANDVLHGFLTLTRNVKMDGMRVRYTNGGVAQSSFFMELCARPGAASPPINSLESHIDGSSPAVMSRSGILATDGVDYALVGKGSAGGLDVGIVQHEAATPLKSDTALVMSTSTVGTGGSKIIDTTAIPSGATAVQIKAAGNNGNAVIYLATSQAGSVGGIGAGDELSAGQAVTFSLGVGTTTDVWAASSTGTARYRLTWTTGGGV